MLLIMCIGFAAASDLYDFDDEKVDLINFAYGCLMWLIFRFLFSSFLIPILLFFKFLG